MRTIKFRSWNHDDMRMEYNPSFFFSVRMGLNDAIREIDDDVLMQYTGLEDSNNIPVYEGDIMESTNKSTRGVVEWVVDGFSIKLQLTSKKDFFLNDITEFWTVIGNIYENPELLEKGVK